MHFSFHWLLYDDLRNTLFDKVIKRNSSFPDFDYQEKVLLLFHDINSV